MRSPLTNNGTPLFKGADWSGDNVLMVCFLLQDNKVCVRSLKGHSRKAAVRSCLPVREGRQSGNNGLLIRSFNICMAMANASTSSGVRPTAAPPVLDSLLPRSIWHAPLVPAALAVTTGILLDRHTSLPISLSLIVSVLALVAWFCTRASPHWGLPLVYLTLAGVAFGAAYHHYRRDVYASDDIAHFAKDEPTPVQLRGFLDEEPVRNSAPSSDPLRSFSRPGTIVTVLRVTQIRRRDNWMSVSGRVRVAGVEGWPELHCGDTVEIVGQLALVRLPVNPGEFDFADHLRDQGIRTMLAARKTPQAVTRLDRGWTTSFTGWLAVIRGRGQKILHDALPKQSEG